MNSSDDEPLMVTMMDTLRNLATAVPQGSDHQWYLPSRLAEAIKRNNLSITPELDAAFIAALSPATVLKLLEMITLLQEGIESEHSHWDEDNTTDACLSLACQALVRVKQIARGLK